MLALKKLADTMYETMTKLPLLLYLLVFDCDCVSPRRRIVAYTASSSFLVSLKNKKVRDEEEFCHGLTAGASGFPGRAGAGATSSQRPFF